MAEKFSSMQEAIKAFEQQYDPEKEKIAEQVRCSVVERFPLESWSNMPIEEYALGQDSKDNFCSWMEYKTREIGSIKGGSAMKHLIFKRKGKPTSPWYYDESSYDNEQDAWKNVRDGFVEAFEKAKKGEWDEIDQIPAIINAPSLRAKTLFVYFPNEFIPIYSDAHIRHFLKVFEYPESDIKSYDVISNNRKLCKLLYSREEFKNWGKNKMMSFLYACYDPRESKRIVKIAPGRNAIYWDDCLNEGYICVGWDEIGDLREFESEETFRAKFAEIYGEEYKHHKAQITKKAKELWTLIQLEPGDKVVANKGTSKVLAIGDVVDPGYEWMEERPDYKHIVRIKWDTSFQKNIEPQKRWALVTVGKVSSSQYSRLISEADHPPDKPVPIDLIYTEISDALESKGQAILYGPPGTGKTYHAMRFAVWWLSKRLGNDKPEAVLSNKEVFNKAEEKISTGRLSKKTWWIVANPKEWRWEDLFKKGSELFRYGRVKKNYSQVQEGDLIVGYQANPDKQIIALARITKGLHKTDQGELKIKIEPVAKVNDGLAYLELQQDQILSKSEPMRNRCQGTLFALTEEESDHILSILAEKNPDLEDHVTSETATGYLTNLTFHASYSYEDFIEGFRPVDTGSGTLNLQLNDGVFKRICTEAVANPEKSYLLLIDEINRANVAKVFGEIITLLEKDKRGIKISLPQSKEVFTIPSNVFVLGTMNTADRSIKLLDAALRRRFAFIELMPDIDLLKGSKVSNLPLDDFLEELNQRIAKTEGREKQIGHSFLLQEDGEPISDPEEFTRRFKQEMLPLLQEFCYDDYQALASYIGEKLVDKEAHVLDQEIISDSDRLVEALEKEFTNTSSE